MTQAEQEERQQRIRDALDRFYNHEHTKDDLAIISHEICFNYRPRTDHERKRRISF